MINSRKKIANEEFGLKGYPDKYPEIVDFHNLKQRYCLVAKDMKTKRYLDQYVQDHSLDPGPKYET